MKKNVLALSITAALVGLGFAGGAQAIGLVNKASANPIPPGAATTLAASRDGIGQFLYVPYFSVQGGNTTMINLVNTDTLNGKAVKVRFRGAGNSDDLFDFQVFLSPSDVWTASVSRDASGYAIMKTADNSCTKPAKSATAGDKLINDRTFDAVRMNGFRTGDALANETREGYVEIFNMADIPSGTSLFTAIKHVSSKPPCSGTAWTRLDTDPADLATANSYGLYAPTTGLMANWIILNAGDAGAWSGAAPAINAVNANRDAAPGAVVYFPQTNAALGATANDLAKFTADPWLVARPDYAMVYDLPDFSIPYTATPGPVFQVSLLNATLATTKVINEFLSVSSTTLTATSDWVLSMPTRRYAVAYDYFSTATDKRVYTPSQSAYFTSSNTTVIDKQICVTGTTSVSYDQEENTPLNPGDSVIISPVLPGQPSVFLICGEASVLSFNQGEKAATSGLITSASGTLKATVARSAIENGYVAGWTSLNTQGILTGGLPGGLPIVGYDAVRAPGASVGGFSYVFGATLPHRTNLLSK